MTTKAIYEYKSPQRTFVPNMKLKYFHIIELLHNSFVAMVTVVTKATMCLHWHILSQGTYVPNMDLRYSHKAELLHISLVAMVTALYDNKGYL